MYQRRMNNIVVAVVDHGRAPSDCGSLDNHPSGVGEHIQVKEDVKFEL